MITIADIPLVDVVQVEALDGHRLALTFEDGKRGVYDVAPLFERGVFRALKNPALFRAVRLEGGTVAWPGDIDIAPERLYTDCVPIE